MFKFDVGVPTKDKLMKKNDPDVGAMTKRWHGDLENIIGEYSPINFIIDFSIDGRSFVKFGTKSFDNEIAAVEFKLKFSHYIIR